MIFLDNKYTRWYYNIIDHRKKNIFEGYTENHHIIPSCMGGSNSKDNLVSLSAKEHFICHLLLTKMIDDSKLKGKLIYALKRMLYENKNHKRYLTKNSRTYQYIRERVSEETSKWSLEMWKNDEFRNKMSENTKFWNKKRWSDLDYKNNIRSKTTEFNKKLWNNDEYADSRKKHSLACSERNKKWWQDQTYRDNQIESSRKRAKAWNEKLWNDPEFRKRKKEQTSKQMKELWSDPIYKERVLQKRKETRQKRIANKLSLEDFFS